MHVMFIPSRVALNDKKLKSILKICLVVLLVALLAYVIFYISQTESDPAPSEADSSSVSTPSQPTTTTSDLQSQTANDSSANNQTALSPSSADDVAASSNQSQPSSTQDQNSADNQVVDTSQIEPVDKLDEPVVESQPQQAPSINISQNNTTLTASGLGLSSFTYLVASNQPMCSDKDTNSTYTAGASVSGLAHQQWVCFRAKDSASSYYYAFKQVDLTRPQVAIYQYKDKVNFSASTSNNSSIMNGSWQNFITQADLEPNCNDADFATLNNSSRSVSGSVVNINRHDNNRWLCLRVKNSLGVSGFAKIKLDYNPPVITISTSQNGNTLSASTTASDLPSTPEWRKSGPNTTSACNSSTSFSAGNVIGNITYNNSYYCFSVTDKVGNDGFNVFFAKKPTLPPAPTPNLTRPILSAIQTTDKVVAMTNISRSANSSFGEAVSISGDYMAVGANSEDGDSGSNTGAVYIFKRDGTRWELEQEISDKTGSLPRLEVYDEFGFNVSLSGNRLVVGAPEDNGVGTNNASITNSGAVYIFKRTGSTWALEQEISKQATNETNKILGLTRLEANDYFGSRVALDGERLVVGAYKDDGANNTSNSGAVYIFKRTGSTWSLEQEISRQPTNTDNKILGLMRLKTDDYFGISVDLDGSRLVVGTPYDDGTNATWSGAVYIFKRTGTAWALEQEISKQATDSDNKILGLAALKTLDLFGHGVALDVDILVVGAPHDGGLNSTAKSGAVYIFKRTGTTWALELEISKQTTSETNKILGLPALQANDRFGGRVVLDGGRLVAGAYTDDGTGATDAGAVYIFKRTGTTWALELEISKQTTSETNKILGLPALQANDWFGIWIALDGDYLVVGAHQDDSFNAPNSGAAYIFKRTGTAWRLERELSEDIVVVSTSWQSFKTTDSISPTCSDSYTGWSSLTASRTAKSVAITSSDNDKWVCFRAKNWRGVYGYTKLQIDF